MRIAMTGASGFIGKHLTQHLAEQGHKVVPLGRHLFSGDTSVRLAGILEECDVLINLAGAPINRRWTTSYKMEMYKSRVDVTTRLIRALKSVVRPPKVMISTSAVGYYPSVGEHDEQNRMLTKGFLASLCRDWERVASMCPSETRLVIARLGVVLAPDGGAMKQMVTPVLRTKFSAVIGSGEQGFSWVAMQDVCKAITFFINHPQTQGVYNLVSPQQITQGYLASALARAYSAWGVLPVPAFAFRCLFGEMATTLINGQRVIPRRLCEAGFEFSVPTVEELLRLT